jgi:WD40 repeat protein
MPRCDPLFERSLATSSIAVLLLFSTAAHSQKPELVVETGHTEWVDSVAFSPDGRTLVSGSWDNTIKVWDVNSGTELRTLAGGTEKVNSVAFNHDGRTVASGSFDNTIKLWDVVSGRELRTLSGHANPVRSVAFSPDGRTLASGGERHNAIEIFDVASGRELRTLAGHVEAVAFSPDGRTLASGGDIDGSIKIFDLASGQVLRILAGHTSWVEAVAFSLDGRTLASGSNDKTIKLWDVASGRELRTFAGHRNSVKSVAFSPDGRTLASGSDSIKLWDAASGRELHSLAVQIGPVWSVAFSPDGRTLASGSDSIKLWDAASGRELRTLAGHTDRVRSVALSPDGRTLASGGNRGSGIKIFDLAGGRELYSLAGHTSWVDSVAFSPDGRILASASDDHTIKLWDVASERELRSLAGHTDEVNSIAFSRNGHTLASGSGDNTIKLWDVASGRELRTLVGHTEKVNFVAFSPDGRTLASASDDGTIKLWDVVSGRVRTLSDLTDWTKWMVYSVAFSPDGRTLASASFPPTIKLWDVASSRVRTLTDDADPKTPVTFSSDGRTLASGGWDNTIKLWDAASGRDLRTVAGHTNSVTSVVFTPSGRFIFSGSLDGSVRVWNATSGELLATLYAFDQNDWVVVDPVGRFDTNNLDGGAPLHWVLPDDPMRPLPLEIFMRDYFTPGLLTRILKDETLPSIKSIAEITNLVQPDVKIVGVGPSADDLAYVDVTIHAAGRFDEEKKQQSGLQDLRLLRDGQLVGSGYVDLTASCAGPGTQTGRVRAGYIQGVLQDCDYTFHDVQLKSGAKKVTFTAYAFNSERIKSATASLDYEPKPKSAAPPVKPTAYLLQIGVNHYAASSCELNYSVADAEKMSEELAERLSNEGYSVQPVKLESSEGGNAQPAGREAIKQQLSLIAAQATPDDVFFMSFSGHGYSAPDGEFYILPSDIRGSCHAVDGAMLKTAISADELADWLRPIDAGQMTLILDACFSAESVQSGDFKPGPLGSRGLGQLAYDKRMRILAASQSDEVAHEYNSLHHGLLTYVLTHNGLDEGKADWKPIDRKIMVGEWLSYAANSVPKFVPPSRSSASASKAAGDRFGNNSTNRTIQIPALFDFSKLDSLQLQ